MRTFIIAGCIALIPGLAAAESGLTASQISAATQACGGPIASAKVLPSGQLSVKCQRTAAGKQTNAEGEVVSQGEGGGGLFGIGGGTAGAISTSTALGIAGFATVGLLAAVGANNDSSSGTVSTSAQ
ncbi:MAG: hypothetical protein AAGF94_14615 [Pseudomonadota bacterium]